MAGEDVAVDAPERQRAAAARSDLEESQPFRRSCAVAGEQATAWWGFPETDGGGAGKSAVAVLAAGDSRLSNPPPSSRVRLFSAAASESDSAGSAQW